LIFEQFTPPAKSDPSCRVEHGENSNPVSPVSPFPPGQHDEQRDPGVLGCYGFRNRADHSYQNMVSQQRRHQAQTGLGLSEDAGKQSVVIAPQTYPTRPINGHMVGDFLTPSTRFTYPAILSKRY
jgi:hypothetical protein